MAVSFGASGIPDYMKPKPIGGSYGSSYLQNASAAVQVKEVQGLGLGLLRDSLLLAAAKEAVASPPKTFRLSQPPVPRDCRTLACVIFATQNTMHRSHP